MYLSHTGRHYCVVRVRSILVCDLVHQILYCPSYEGYIEGHCYFEVGVGIWRHFVPHLGWVTSKLLLGKKDNTRYFSFQGEVKQLEIIGEGRVDVSELAEMFHLVPNTVYLGHCKWLSDLDGVTVSPILGALDLTDLIIVTGSKLWTSIDFNTFIDLVISAFNDTKNLFEL